MKNVAMTNMVLLTNTSRDSNMELLRIVAMFFILIVHVDFLGLSLPSKVDLQMSPISTFSRVYIGALTSICVNLFVMISGWYSIKLKTKSILKLIFQTYFFCVFMYLCFGEHSCISSLFSELMDILLLKHYWFVRAYLLLVIMAPTINSYVEHASRKDVEKLIIVYFLFQTLFSYISNDVWYHDGYSPLTFWGLYLFTRYMRIYKPNWSLFSIQRDIALSFGMSLIITGISLFLLYNDFGGGRMFNYTSPFLLFVSVYFFLIFTKISFHSQIVNWVAKSSFAAYLLHMNPHFIDKWFVDVIQHWWKVEPTGLFVLIVTAYILGIFVVSILIDKIQIILSNIIGIKA